MILNAFTNSARSPSGVAEIGGYITCGSYEQNGSHTDGKEKIEWLVLDISDGKALVVSKYALDVKPYNVIEGDVLEDGDNVSYGVYGIRPAMWISIE